MKKAENYNPKLSVNDTEIAIKFILDTFEAQLSKKLNLRRISAPLFVLSGNGINDDLNGVEKAVSFEISETHKQAEIVHSLAKWKRFALGKYGFEPGVGIYTDMNAIRRNEICDELHSIYVDQWDWEKVITKTDRNRTFLKKTVKNIYTCIKNTAKKLNKLFPELENYLPENITFITSQELENKFPDLSMEDRERAFVKQTGAAFVMQIGGDLKSGKKHGMRAPDYDDWKLNGDIIFYYPPLDCSFELSSMGIRVDANSLKKQLSQSGKNDYLNLDFHKMLINDKLPLTIGGGIGQSRLCMFLLNKAHIGEVQASLWPDEMIKDCENRNIKLL